MYASNNHNLFARRLLQDYFEKISKNREYIRIPNTEQMQQGVKKYLENMV